MFLIKEQICLTWDIVIHFPCFINENVCISCHLGSTEFHFINIQHADRAVPSRLHPREGLLGMFLSSAASLEVTIIPSVFEPRCCNMWCDKFTSYILRWCPDQTSLPKVLSAFVAAACKFIVFFLFQVRADKERKTLDLLHNPDVSRSIDEFSPCSNIIITHYTFPITDKLLPNQLRL